MSSYRCEVCGYIYDEEAGCPEEGIPPDTLWEDLPEHWPCPDCGALKESFASIT